MPVVHAHHTTSSCRQHGLCSLPDDLNFQQPIRCLSRHGTGHKTPLLQTLGPPAVYAVQAATAVGMASIAVPGAGVTESQAASSVVGKKITAATPAATAVPDVLVPAATPAATTPAVAVSGQHF